MKNVILILGLISILSTNIAYPQSQKPSDPKEELSFQDIHLADPSIFLYDDTYYLYGTSQGELTRKGTGFLVYASQDLENWRGPVGTTDGFALKEGQSFGSHGFWAPQVFQYNNKFYMAYTANENTAIAISDHPLGPFQNLSQDPVEATVRQIDPYIFIDDDGRKYIYHVRLEEGNKIFVAEMEDDLQTIKPKTFKEIITAEKEWENTENDLWTVAEGPTVIKRNDSYYLIYSANDFRNPDYAVGYATSTSPLGPWKKSGENPLIHRDFIGENGSGHGDILIGRNGAMYYVFHTHFSENEVHPRRAAIVEIGFNSGQEEPAVLEIKTETFRFLKQKINDQD